MFRLRFIFGLLCLAGSFAVAGCAGGLSYPSTANIDRVAKGTLSPAQQKAVIQDLQRSTAGGSAEAPTPLVKATTETPAE